MMERSGITPLISDLIFVRLYVILKRIVLDKKYLRHELIIIIKTLAALTLAITFLISGVGKFVNPYIFIETFQSIIRFNEEILVLVASVLPIIEIVVALMLMYNIRISLTVSVIIVLMIVFVVFSVYGAIKNIPIDCGCFGNIFTSKIGWGMVLRNVFLLVLTIALLIWETK